MDALDLKISNSEVHFKKGIDVKKYSAEERKKLADVSKQFENILTGMMLKSMTSTTEGLFGKDNYGGDVLDVLFESEISNFITESQGMGVAEKIYKSITGELLESKITRTNGKDLLSGLPSKPDTKIRDIKSKKELTNPSAMERLEKFGDIIKTASKKYSVDQQLIKSVILTESAAKPDAKSKANAKGLMQLMDSTATDMGVKNSWDPKDNIFGGTKYLSKLLNEYDGDIELSLAAYNAGPGNVKKYNGIPPFKETQNYIKRVTNYLKILDE